MKSSTNTGDVPAVGSGASGSALRYSNADLAYRLRVISANDRYCFDDWSADILRQAADSLMQQPAKK